MSRLGTHKEGRASLVATGSATLFAAVDGGRPHLTKGALMVSVGTGLALMSIQETTSGGTSAAVLVGKISASAPMVFPFDFGEKGIAASSTSSRVVFVLETSNASAFCNAVGYTR